MAMRFLLPVLLLFLVSCGSEPSDVNADDSAFMDSMISARNHASVADTSPVAGKDTVFHTALPTVFEGDIILENCNIPSAVLAGELMGGKYNHAGIIFQRQKDGLLCVLDVTDTVRITPLTEYVDRARDGQVCVLRLKDANKTLNEDKIKALKAAGKAYKGVAADPVLNWDDSHLYSSELVWKVYNNAMTLTLCPTHKVADFKISDAKQKEVEKAHGGEVSPKDEAVSPDDIYHSQKLEIIYEK
jgi:hypothetical protein